MGSPDDIYFTRFCLSPFKLSIYNARRKTARNDLDASFDYLLTQTVRPQGITLPNLPDRSLSVTMTLSVNDEHIGRTWAPRGWSFVSSNRYVTWFVTIFSNGSVTVLFMSVSGLFVGSIMPFVS